MEPNKHAELIKQYAEDCINYEKPWRQWEKSQDCDTEWYPLTSPPWWEDNWSYRRKPKTYKINVEFTTDEVYAVGEVIPPNAHFWCTYEGQPMLCFNWSDKITLVNPISAFKTKEAAQKWLDTTKLQ